MKNLEVKNLFWLSPLRQLFCIVLSRLVYIWNKKHLRHQYDCTFIFRPSFKYLMWYWGKTRWRTRGREWTSHNCNREVCNSCFGLTKKSFFGAITQDLIYFLNKIPLGLPGCVYVTGPNCIDRDIWRRNFVPQCAKERQVPVGWQ